MGGSAGTEDGGVQTAGGQNVSGRNEPGGVSAAPQEKAPVVVLRILPLPTEPLVINFGRNSNEFSAGTLKALDRLAIIMSQNPGAALTITGYTDSEGNYHYNRSLSRFRANMVKSYLLGKGVSGSGIKVVGMGSENPAESNATLEGRRANRRVVIELFPENA